MMISLFYNSSNLTTQPQENLKKHLNRPLAKADI